MVAWVTMPVCRVPRVVTMTICGPQAQDLAPVAVAVVAMPLPGLTRTGEMTGLLSSMTEMQDPTGEVPPSPRMKVWDGIMALATITGEAELAMVEQVGDPHLPSLRQEAAGEDQDPQAPLQWAGLVSGQRMTVPPWAAGLTMVAPASGVARLRPDLCKLDLLADGRICQSPIPMESEDLLDKVVFPQALDQSSPQTTLPGASLTLPVAGARTVAAPMVEPGVWMTSPGQVETCGLARSSGRRDLACQA